MGCIVPENILIQEECIISFTEYFEAEQKSINKKKRQSVAQR